MALVVAAPWAAAQKVGSAPVTGADSYRNYCATCHGSKGKGNGPTAKALKSAPADLTQLNKGNAGQFPAERVTAILNGLDTISAHGRSDMPVWGPIFGTFDTDQAITAKRISNLVEYLRGMQGK
ncbi:MAG: c-type cytochrome [Acidobacteria bacterium]|nr:c-type cytochrome [Acidobacteriota bacterium]